MTKAFIVSGTDTGIGKTTVAAMLTLGLKGVYWKPIQSGTKDGTDRERVKALTALSDDHFVRERYILSEALSPHRAAELDKTEVAVDNLSLPETQKTLLIEGAGGLLVPLTRHQLQIDLFALWKVPVILCARTTLGTINHTLLSVEALKRRKIPIQGLIFCGEDNADNMKTIAEFSKCKILGHVPKLDEINAVTLSKVFAERFMSEDFR